MFFVATLVLIFILRCRFPENIPISQLIINRYGQLVLRTFRSLEKISFKIKKCESDFQFLNTCQHYEVYPKFVQFKVNSINFNRTVQYQRCQLQILKHEIQNQATRLRDLKTERERLKTGLASQVSYIDLLSLQQKIAVNVEKRIQIVHDRHKRKLRNLGIDESKTVDTDKVVYNLSSKVISDRQTKLLSLGLSFGIPFAKIEYTKFFTKFEVICHTLNKINESCSGMYNDSLRSVYQRISNLANTSYSILKKQTVSSPVFCRGDLRELKLLKNDPSIIITKPDKGRGAVILDKAEYINKIDTILSDRSKFALLKDDVYKIILSLEEKLNRILRPLKEQLGQTTYDFIRASGSIPGTMYGLVKTHKNGYPVRPIVSSINTFNYNLSKFLVTYLSPLTYNQYTIKNTYSFVEQVKNVNFEVPTVMASFDVVSLFTNVPLKETCNIAINRLYNADNEVPFAKKTFSKLLDIASSESVFLFNSKVYKQIDGCSMGGALSPTLANIFLGHHEEIWLRNCPLEFRPLFFRRYVDDCFLIFRNREQIPMFLQYLNCKHPNIQFTCEIENNNCLPFLDCVVERNGNRFTTSVYRKPSFTGLGLNFFSWVPMIFKINSIKTLLNRAYTLSGNFHKFHQEILKLKEYFMCNRYPLQLIDNVINKFLTARFVRIQKPPSVPKLKRYIKLPYFGPQSYEMRNQLKVILKEVFFHIDFQIVLTNPYTIGSFFKIKDHIPPDVQSRVIYNYECSSCNARYVGSTIRSFKSRRLSHMGRSIHTGRPLTNPEFSNIRIHSEENDHPVLHENFKILHTMPDQLAMLIAESIIIKKEKPVLNTQTRSIELFIV